MISFCKFWLMMDNLKTVRVIENDELKELKINCDTLCKITGLSTNVFNAMLPPKPGKEYKRRKGSISMNSIDVICQTFNCQPSDIMEFINEV